LVREAEPCRARKFVVFLAMTQYGNAGRTASVSGSTVDVLLAWRAYSECGSAARVWERIKMYSWFRMTGDVLFVFEIQPDRNKSAWANVMRYNTRFRCVLFLLSELKPDISECRV
jgi:hypothetical protein